MVISIVDILYFIYIILYTKFKYNLVFFIVVIYNGIYVYCCLIMNRKLKF